jgi:HEAT repeat protein/mono/diheme cytochrome c family protein
MRSTETIKVSPHSSLPGVLLALSLSPGVLGDAPARAPIEPERFVFLLEYVATDYQVAVEDGAIVNAFEYREMQDLSSLLVDRFDDLRQLGASEEISTGLLELQDRIGVLAPAAEIHSRGTDLAERLLTELEIRAVPAAAPDLERGRELFVPNCSPCHGRSGAGDGPSSPGMEPSPASFLAPRMDLLAPHQVYGAIKFGIQGTAMPSFGLAFDDDDIWGLAFFVRNLRDEPAGGPAGSPPMARRVAGSGARPATVLSVGNAEDPRVRRWAAWTLGRSGTISPDASEALLLALADEDLLVRRYASVAVVAFGPTLAPRLTALIESNPVARPHAEAALIALGGPTVPEVVRLLENREPAAQASAVRILTEIGPPAAPAIPFLIEALRGTSSRARCVRIAAALGATGSASVTPLTRLFESSDRPLTREMASRALGFAGPRASEAVPLLLDALGDPDGRIRFTAAAALGRIRTVRAVEPLVERVRHDTNRTVRMYSIEALGEIGPGANAAVPALIEVFAREDDNLAGRAAWALAGIGVLSMPALLQALENPDPRTRAHASHALGLVGADPGRVVPPLIGMLGDDDNLVRERAATALVELGADAVPYLGQALTGDPNWHVRGFAALTLGRMTPPRASAVPLLISALDDENATVRQLACWSLGRLGGQAAEATEPLSRALSSSEVDLRRMAIWALGNIGPAALLAKPALVALLEDPEPLVRDEAVEALQKLAGTYDYTGGAGEAR